MHDYIFLRTCHPAFNGLRFSGALDVLRREARLLCDLLDSRRALSAPVDVPTAASLRSFRGRLDTADRKSVV